jgi:hypothetical protein
LSLSKSVFAFCALCALLASTACAQSDTAADPDPAPDPVASTPVNKPILKRLFSLEAVGATLPGALVQQMHDWPSEWGGRRLGFEKRVGSLYGQFVVGVLIENGVKAIDHEDTRYFRLGKGNFFKRTAHVVTGTLVARKPDGGRMFAWSVPANAYGSWAIATLWSPREFRTAGSIFEWGSAGMGVSAGTNLLREFWPDVKGIFRKKK